MYKSLQAGRAIAALLVMLFHLGKVLAREKSFNLPELALPFSFGDSGVEFFFVLSGFIIMTVHRKDVGRPKSVWSYVAKRLIRIYPVYWIVFAAIVLLSFLTGSQVPLHPQSWNVWIKSLLLLPQDKVVLGGQGAPVLNVAWTLQYEVVFYSFFLLAILNRTLAWVVGAVWLLLCTVYRGYTLPFPAAFFLTDFVFVFFLGLLISEISRRTRGTVQQWYKLLIVGLVLYGISALDSIFDTYILGDVRILHFGICSAIILLALVKLEDHGIVIGGSKILQALGDASYSLYLLHFSVMTVVCKVFLHFHFRDLGYGGALIVYVVSVVVCVIVALQFHKWIEKPMLVYLRRIC